MSTTHKEQLIITGPTKIKTTQVAIAGSKNAALPIIAASILATKPVVLTRIPPLADTCAMLETLSYLGGKIRLDEKMNIHITPENIKKHIIPLTLAKKMRTSFLFLGPLLATAKQAIIPLPGGCKIGARPVDIHLDGLRKMGAEIKLENNTVYAKAPNGLKAIEYTLAFPTVTGTENLIMAACLADGCTVLNNAARDPEVTNLIDFLNTLGAQIEGRNSSTISITGKKQLHGGEHSIIGDRIEAGTYLIAAAITQGSITLNNINPEHLDCVLEKLKEAGASIKTTKDSIQLTMQQQAKATSIVTETYPGFPTDLQAQWLTLNTIAKGRATITEKIYENRMAHAQQLCTLGANIQIDKNVASTKGNEQLHANQILATDLRASAGLVLAALVAHGETTISDIHHIDRGYSHLEENLMSMGVKIRRIHKKSNDHYSIKENIKMIIFDWDGTLVNSLPLLIQVHQQVIKTMGLPKPNTLALQSLMGAKASTVIRELFPSLSANEQERYLKLYVDYYRKDHTHFNMMDAATKECLQQLHAHNIQICIATNKRREFFQNELQKSGIKDLISMSCCGDEYPAKPHTDMLDAILQNTHIRSENCLVVGDHNNDIVAAKKAGIHSLAVSDGSLTASQLEKYKPTFMLSRVAQMSEWLDLEAITA